MTTAVASNEAAKVERTEPVAAAGVLPVDANTNPAILPPIPLKPGSGLDAQDFVRANRIHVKDGSLFIDPYLVIHPRELAPQNDAALRAKLNLTYSITNPSFYEAPERTAIALNLGQLVPLSLATKRSQLLNQVKQFNKEVDSKTDANLTALANDKRHPMAAIVRDTVKAPDADPAGVEVLKNGLAIYMLVREKLTSNGYYNRLSDYVTRMSNPDQVLGDLADNIGATPQQVREAALKGGVDGIGKLLGIDPRYVADVKKLADYAATQDFGYNLVEHWHLGRQLLGIDAPLQQKIATGLDARISAKIGEYRARVRQHYDVPAPAQAMEAQVASGLNLVEPIQRKLLYALGYEICFSPEMTADDIAFHRGIYGLHRKSANDLRDVRGTYRIYFAGKGDPEGSMRTLVHETAHNLWPEQFTPQQVAKIDQLAANDQQRFHHLHAITADPAKFDQFVKLHAAYKAGDEREKAAVTATASELLGVPVGPLFASLKDPYALRHLVAFANDTLQVEGERYNKSGYDSPQERFREVISRFAELKQVRLRGEPELLNFIAPGLNEIWNTLYIPHLEKVYSNVMKTDVKPVEAAAPRPLPESATAPAPQPQPPVVAPEHPQPTSTNAHACILDGAAQPSSQVSEYHLDMTPSVFAARDALKSMGVNMSFK